MGFAGHLRYELEVEAETDGGGLRMLGEETVVVAFAVSQTVPLSVEGHPGYHDEVEVAGIRMILRFRNMEVAFRKHRVFSQLHGDDVVAYDRGQDDGFPMTPFLNERQRLHLVGQGGVEHHFFRSKEMRMGGKLAKHRFRLLPQLFWGVLLFGGTNLLAQFSLIHSAKRFQDVKEPLCTRFRHRRGRG